VLLLLAGVLVGCGGPTTLTEAPLAEPPAVDGTLAEWDDRLTPVGNDPVSMAALPTDSLLYVSVIIRDQALVRTVVQNGLVVWVDPDGQQRRRYGVQYPLGLRRQQAGRRRAGGGSRMSLDDVSLRELEVVQGDTLRQRIPARYSSGLRAVAALNPSSVLCELAIPVHGSGASHALPAALGPSVSLGVFTPTPDDDSEAQLAPDPDIGGATPRTRTNPRERRQRNRQRRQALQQQLPSLDLWTTLRTR
jgi:hypothetical protein